MTTVKPGVHECHKKEKDEVGDEELVWVWGLIPVSALIGIIAIVCNGLVIYFARRSPMIGTMRHLNKVVMHLAVSDLLVGTLGSPLQIISFKMGKI